MQFFSKVFELTCGLEYFKHPSTTVLGPVGFLEETSVIFC